MLRRQAYKFELYQPAGEQVSSLRKFFGCKRVVYNRTLAANEEMRLTRDNKGRAHDKNRHTRYQADKLLTNWKTQPGRPWLTEVPSHCLQQALVDLEKAYERFYEQLKKGFRVAPKSKKLRKILKKKRIPLAYPPVFKKKGKRDSVRFPDGFKLDSDNGRVWFSKLGWMRYRKSQDVSGTPKNVTVSESCGKFFVSIQVEHDVEPADHPSSSDIGIDMGVAVFATMSDTSTSIMPDTSRLEARKKFLQRKLKNKKKFSSNWKKLQLRIKKTDKLVSNVRDNHRHQFTNAITKNHGIVYGDDLEIKKMSKSSKGTEENPGKKVKQKSGLNRVLLAQGIGEVNRQLKYKSEWRGGIYIPCPPAYGSQRCPQCGNIAKENRKKQELFRCINPECQFEANADWVAALNKLEAGRAFVACGEFPSWTRFSSGASKKSSAKQEPAESIHA